MSGVGAAVGVGLAANEASTCRATIACRSGVGTDKGVVVGKVVKSFDTPAVIVAWRSGVAAGEDGATSDLQDQRVPPLYQ